MVWQGCPLAEMEELGLENLVARVGLTQGVIFGRQIWLNTRGDLVADGGRPENEELGPSLGRRFRRNPEKSGRHRTGPPKLEAVQHRHHRRDACR